MPLAYEHVGSKKPAKINTYMHTRAELLITLCYEIPCSLKVLLLLNIRSIFYWFYIGSLVYLPTLILFYTNGL